jgi:hypothetical protein
VKDKVRLPFLLLTILSAGILISVTYRYSREWFMVDRCLSDNHGSFDYSRMSCDLENNHPYVLYEVRHPRDRRVAEIAFVSFAAFLAGYFYSRGGDQKLKSVIKS